MSRDQHRESLLAAEEAARQRYLAAVDWAMVLVATAATWPLPPCHAAAVIRARRAEHLWFAARDRRVDFDEADHVAHVAAHMKMVSALLRAHREHVHER